MCRRFILKCRMAEIIACSIGAAGRKVGAGDPAGPSPRKWRFRASRAKPARQINSAVDSTSCRLGIMLPVSIACSRPLFWKTNAAHKGIVSRVFSKRREDYRGMLDTQKHGFAIFDCCIDPFECPIRITEACVDPGDR